MDEQFYETPEEAASALKFPIAELMDNWFDDHDVFDERQRETIARAVHKMGFAFFHEELIEYFEQADGFEVTIDEEIIYHE